MKEFVATKIMRASELWDRYVSDVAYSWDIYQEWTKSDIEQVLLDEGVEYESSDLDDLLEYAHEMQQEMVEQDKENNINDLYYILDNAITDTDFTAHLSGDEIGKVLVALACSYFNG